MRHLTAVVQITDRCNLSCRYCYVPENGTDMTMETFEVLVDKMLQKVGEEGSISIIYHGGEPLLRGLPFFKEATDFLNRRGGRRRISTSIQSNGTLLTDDFADFIIENDIPCGISLDGPAEVHNFNRGMCRAKKGSFDLVMRGVEKLRSRGRKVSALCVLTRASLPKLKEIYEFFNSQGMDFKINPIDLIGRSAEEREALEISPVEYGRALTDLFDLWFNDRNTRISISNLYDAMRSLSIGIHTECIYASGACGSSYLGVSPNGDLYPCNRFSAYPEFRIGNVLEDNLSDVFRGGCLVQFGRRSDELKECASCEFKPVCNGGCTSRAYSRHHSISERDYFCASIKAVYGHVQKVLGNELEVAYGN